MTLPGVRTESCVGYQRVCFRAWYQVPIALRRINLPGPFAELNLPGNLSGLHSWKHHLLVIVLPSDHLPFVNRPRRGNVTTSWSLPIVQFGKTESEAWQSRGEGGGKHCHAQVSEAKMCCGKTASLCSEPAEGACGQARAILCPRQPDGSTNNIDAFCLETFMAASHFPTSRGKRWASPKPLCLLHGSGPTVQADEAPQC